MRLLFARSALPLQALATAAAAAAMQASAPAVGQVAGTPRQKPATSVYFASFEAAERRFYGSFGAKFALLGALDQPGFRLLASAGAKLRERNAATSQRESQLSEARLLAGHEWHVSGLSLALYAGLGSKLHTPGVRRNTGEAHRIRPAAMIELWQSWPAPANPSRFSSLTLSLEGAGSSLYLGARHGFGHDALPFAFGPEASVHLGARISVRGRLAQQSYRKARLGLHLSEMALAGITWRLSGGAEWRDERRRRAKHGGYAALAAHYLY